ncbi:MAG: hypothetical protein H7838_11105 [Magnetococcus sp. DMHC-8]
MNDTLKRGIYTQDWRDESAYPKPGETSMRRWASEFAMRNPFIQKRTEHFPSTERLDLRIIRHMVGLKDFRSFGIGYIVTLEVTSEESKPLVEFPCIQLNRSIRYDHPDKKFHPATAPVWVKIMFDLTIPINWQIEEAKKELNKARKRAEADGNLKPFDPKPNTEKFPLYLRLLDARDAGAAKDEIIRVLYPEPSRRGETPNSKKYTQNLKAAMAYRDGDYEELLYMEDPESDVLCG